VTAGEERHIVSRSIYPLVAAKEKQGIVLDLSRE
jgi:hypothetical protein